MSENFFLTLVILLGLTGTCHAAHPLITDDTGTQGKGKFQLETSVTWMSDKANVNSGGEREIESLATAVFAAGVAEALDVMVTVPYLWTELKEAGTSTKVRGFSDLVAEVKWRFYEQEKLSLAIKPGMLLPTGDDEKGLGTGHYGFTAFFITTYEAEPWGFDVNFGYLHLENRVQEHVTRWFASAAARCKVSEHWKIVGETGAASNPDATDSSHPAFVQLGLIFSPKDNLDLSAGYVFGLSDAEIDSAIRAGVSIRF